MRPDPGRRLTAGTLVVFDRSSGYEPMQTSQTRMGVVYSPPDPYFGGMYTVEVFDPDFSASRTMTDPPRYLINVKSFKVMTPDEWLTWRETRRADINFRRALQGRMPIELEDDYPTQLAEIRAKSNLPEGL